MRILVADNNAENRHSLIQQIEKLGHIAQEAISEREVLNLCRIKCPDLILIAENLSGTSAVTIIHNIRRLGGVAVWNPIVLLVTEFDKDILQQGLEAGADDYFIVPVNILQLSYKIATSQRQIDLKDEVFSIAHDLVMSNRALENTTSADSMTGIADINTFNKSLEQEWFKSKKESTTLSLILLDIDYFKAFNDKYGVEKGDDIIKKIANVLKIKLKSQSCTIARTIGGTFGVLLPNTSIESVTQIAADLHKAIVELQIPHVGSRCSDTVTASFGVTSTVEQELKSPIELLEAADYALYQAKHKGRNKICFEVAES